MFALAVGSGAHLGADTFGFGAPGPDRVESLRRGLVASSRMGQKQGGLVSRPLRRSSIYTHVIT